MSFLAPLSFLFALLTIPIVVMYFLKRKRKKVPIPSTFLWVRAIEDMRVNAPFQRLRTSLLLLLQLLLVVLAATALARPLLQDQPSRGKSLVILVDVSASMGMTDVKPSRLDAAKQAARGAIEALTEEDQIMVISFSNRAEVASPFTLDRTAALGAVEALRPATTATSLREAFQMAVAAARQFANAEILVLSDGNFDPIHAPTDEVPVRFVAIGGTPVNAAITGLDVRKPPALGDPWTVFVFIEHFSKEAREVPVELYVNAALKEVQEVKLEAGRGRAVIFEVTGVAPEFVEVRLGKGDDLAADDRAWFVVSAERKKILVVTLGNFFLEQAIAQYPDLEVDRVQPGAAAGMDMSSYGAVIFEGYSPPGLKDGRYLFMNCLPEWEGFRDEGAVESPMAIDWDRQHPVTRLVEFGSLTVKTARKAAVPGYVKPLVESVKVPLIAAWMKGETRAVAVHFDILQSDWPLRLSFPLFISNAIEWLTREGTGDWQAHRMPGDPLRVRLAPGRSEIEVMTPGGARHVVKVAPGETEASFTLTDEAGIYVVKAGEGTDQLFAVNLMNPVESSGRVIPELRLGEESVKGETTPPAPPREYWSWLAWLALGLLWLEWLVFHRRI